MPKKYSTATTTLLVVESPAKCKKIEEYLGPGYKCIATCGHLREIKSLTDIDIGNNFKINYSIIDNAFKKIQIERLRKEIKNADEVLLSSDLDREGEMISMTIIELFNLPLNTKRITFNEITETAIKNAIQNPRTIDMDLVHAQQARQILDILVGFKITPTLWKCIAQPRGKENVLSAGRCQTPALRLIYDNEQEIKSCEERKVYNVTGWFTNLNLTFEHNSSLESEDDVTNFLDGSADFSHVYTCSQPVKIFKKQPEPFTTSRLQQVASNELHYSPKETMRICQLLYEGGFITYMRTDSKTYSGEFIENIKSYITRNYADGDKYINEEIETMSSIATTDKTKKSKAVKIEKPKAQEAHEAIRPTCISLCELPETVDLKERRMYKLIWTNTLESCMTAASYHSITANISAFQNTKFTRTCELISFPGWKIVEKKYSTDTNEFQYLQQIKQNEKIVCKKIYAKVTMKGSKQHYTEARLVQLLEEKGIGRPSTFSSLVDKILERGYVKKEDIKGRELVCKDFELENDEICEIETKREFGNEKGKLIIQPLGTIVMEFLEKHFNELFEYNYTCLMEEALDKIAKGELIWIELCKRCNDEIDALVEKIKDKPKLEYKIDENNTYLIGKYGPVIKCVEENDKVSFKSVRKDIDFEIGVTKVEDIVDNNKTKRSYILGKYNGLDVVLKKGKFGLYISWGENSKNLKELGNRPMENITFEEIQKYLESGSNLIREINANISIRRGQKGDYLFYKTPKMKKPQFYDIRGFLSETGEDYKICNIAILKSWISEKYTIV